MAQPTIERSAHLELTRRDTANGPQLQISTFVGDAEGGHFHFTPEQATKLRDQIDEFLAWAAAGGDEGAEAGE